MLRLLRLKLLIALGLTLVACAAARAERTILADAYLDKLHGMWLGQILGNYAGRPMEGHDAIGGLNYAIDWNSILQTSSWDGDDDTCFEYLDQHVLSTHSDPSPADITQAWQDHVQSGTFYIANRQARLLMNHGLQAPDTGSPRYNMHWYAIDSQITTESLGAVAPGMRQRAADLAGLFGSATNAGYPLHAAQFYAAMYAAAPFESDVQTLVQKGLEVVPHTSRTYQVIQDVRAWYAANPTDWRATQTLLYGKYKNGDAGRYRYWIESTINTGLTAMAILYGNGNFYDTVNISVQGGFDCDCNAATAGGLIGLMKGYSGLPSELTASATDSYTASSWLVNIPRSSTVSAIAQGWQSVAESQILAAGGSISGSGAGRTYHLGDADTVSPPLEKPDPAGPKGLVGKVKGLGGLVTVSASVDRRSSSDRYNLDAIIDGVTDLSYNGRLPYVTDDGDNPQPAGGDFYQINFDRDTTFTSVLFYEGDIAWSDINADPRVVEPRGGYFLDLSVEVGRGGVFTPVTGLRFSEPLDPYAYFQTIELAFNPLQGDSVRIRGDAGGTRQFTSIVELEAYGKIGHLEPADATLDGNVDVLDLGILGANYGQTNRTWTQGDFSGDGKVDVIDLGILGAHYGYIEAAPGGSPGAVPEPASILLLAAGLLLQGRKRA